jgi:hypothetical protein
VSRELRVHSVPTRAEQARIVVEIVAIVAAGLWALYTFVYEQQIKPLLERPSFSVPTVVDQGPTVNGVTFLTIHKRLENTGDVYIDLAAETLSVYGERVGKRTRRGSHSETFASARISADLPRSPVKLLYSFAKLRSGAVGGSPTSFTLSPHSSGEESFLVAIPAHAYPVVLVTRKDFVEKAPIFPKIPIRIVREPLGGYELKTNQLEGEYDSANEYPIRP